MKKIYSLFLIAAVIAACVGCRAQSHEHSFDKWKTETPATCDSAEVQVRKCKCGEVETREGDPAIGHSYISISAESKLENPVASMVVQVCDLNITGRCGVCGENIAITDGIVLEGTTLALGDNTITVKYGELSTTININAVDAAIDGTVVDDTYIYSSKKDDEYTTKKEMGTKSDLYRVYLRVNVSDILKNEQFLEKKDHAKLQLALAITSGSVTDKTTFTLKAYAPAAGVTDVDFSKLTWNSVDNKEGSVGKYSQLNWNNGIVLVSSGVGHNVSADNGNIIVTLSYSQIADCVDGDGNILFAFATNTSGLKVGSLENKTETNKPAVKVVLNDEHFHVFDQKVADQKYFVSANCKEKTKYYMSCSCGVAGTEIFKYGEIISHSYSKLIPEQSKTCTTDGVKAHHQCTKCGKYFLNKNGQMKLVVKADLKISAGHEYKLVQTPQEPTCTKNGWNKLYKCDDCGKYFDADKNETTKDAQRIPATGHTYTSISAESMLVDPVAGTVATANDIRVTGTCVCGENVEIADAIELEGATLSLGENTVIVKYGELSTTITIVVGEQTTVFDGTVSDDTYVSSGSKNTEYSSRDEMGTNSSSFRVYFRANISGILANEQFLENMDHGKVRLVLAITEGSVTDESTFTLKAYAPAVGITDVAFSELTWNSVNDKEGSVGTYSQLNWSKGIELASNVSADSSKIIITLGYSQIADYVDENGNILFVFATNTSGLKVGSLENAIESNRPALKVILGDDHTHVFDREVAEEKYFASANCEEKAKYYKSCSCGEAGTDTFEYGEVIPHAYVSISAVSKLENPAASKVVQVSDLSVTGICVCGERFDITDGIELEGATLANGENKVTVKYGELSTTVTIVVGEQITVLDGTVSGDTYVSSSNKNTEYSTRDEIGTNSSSFRVYFRVNVSNILESEQFLENKDHAKVQLILAITSGNVVDTTTFTLKTYAPAAGLTDVAFSKLTWNSVNNKEGSVGTYSQLNWSNGNELATNVSIDNSNIIITLDYSQIADYIDENGNILFAFATNTSGLKIGSLENATESNRPAFKVVLN